MLGVQPGQPGDRLRAGQLGPARSARAGNSQHAGVRSPGFGLARPAVLAPVLADGLQHGQPGAAGGTAPFAPRAGHHHLRRGHTHRPLPRVPPAAGAGCWPPARHPVELGRAFVRAVRADRGRRVQGGAAHEHRQLPEQRLLRPAQQVVAPGDRVAHGLLPGRQVVRSLGQLRQRAVQPLQQPAPGTAPAAGPRPAPGPAGSRPADGRFRPRPRAVSASGVSSAPAARARSQNSCAAAEPARPAGRPHPAAPTGRPGTPARPGPATQPGW